MAQRGQFIRRNDRRWTIGRETFRSHFGESSHPRATHLLYEVTWIRTGNTWRNKCANDPCDHAEITFLEKKCEKIKKRKTEPCYITWYLSWSPCGKCSPYILEFLEEHPKVTLDIRVARLYRHYDKRNQKGLKDLDEYGVKISIMDYNDYYHCLKTFVAHQWSDGDYRLWHFLYQIYSEELYSYYSDILVQILEYRHG